MQYTLNFLYFQGDQAVLKDENDNNVSWPKDKLPKDLQEGQTLVFTIETAEEEEKKKNEKAKDILNEILDVGDQE